ncbi:MAG: hypothetical protein JWP11_3808 [Frankiales bacterium]|nr:hypothetical protein [Frankiales bacterium]
MLRCTGTVKRFESKPWSMSGADGVRTGVTHTARVLVGDADFVDVKIPVDGNGVSPVPMPRKGDVVDYAVVPGISGGKVSLSVRGDFADIISSDDEAPAPARRAKAS